MPAVVSGVGVILRRRSRDLGIGIKLAAFGVAYVRSHEPPRHPIRNAFRCVPTGGELLPQHKLVVWGAAGLARVAERQVRRNRLRGDAALRGAIEFGGRATREKCQGDRRRKGRG